MEPGCKLSSGTAALLACQWEATVPKPGNVHRSADFADARFTDFLTSAAVIAPILEQAAQHSLGKTVLQCVHATRRFVDTNTNLGIILLLSPLAMVPAEESLHAGVQRVLATLKPTDSLQVYQAIQMARPGGMGTSNQYDVQQSPPDDLLAAMRLAADRDAIAAEYCSGFQLIFETVVPSLLQGQQAGETLTHSIIHTHLSLLAAQGDSLIERKCGAEINTRVRQQARSCLSALQHSAEDYLTAVSEFDFWLRADGNRRNPGTTADLIAAGLFAIFRDGLWPPPWK